MMYNYGLNNNWGMMGGYYNWNMLGYLSPFILLVVIMDLFLRGFALYKSAQRQQNIWFIALLVINSAGILPLIYLLMHRDFQSANGGQATVAKKTVRRKK